MQEPVERVSGEQGDQGRHSQQDAQETDVDEELEDVQDLPSLEEFHAAHIPTIVHVPKAARLEWARSENVSRWTRLLYLMLLKCISATNCCKRQQQDDNHKLQ